MAEKTAEATSIEQEPAENLGTDALLAGQEGNAPPPPAQEPVEGLGLDDLLGVDGQAAPEPEPEPEPEEPAAA